MNNSVKNQVIRMIFGTQKPEEISHKRHLAFPPYLKNVTTVPCKI